MLDEIGNFWPSMTEGRFIAQIAAIAAAAVIVLGPFGGYKKDTKTNVIRFAASIIGLILIFYALEIDYMLLGNFVPAIRGINFSLAVLTGLLLCGVFRREYRIRERYSLIAVLFSTVVTMMEWSAPRVVEYVESITPIPGEAIEVLSNLLILFFAGFVKRLSLASYEMSPLHATLTCSTAVLSAMAALLYEALYAGAEDNTLDGKTQLYIVVVFTLMYVINLMTYIFSYLVARERQQVLDMRAIEQKQDAELQLLRVAENNLQELREVRHDIKNHTLYMQTMLEEKRYDDLKDYFETFTGKFSEQLFRRVDYGNKMVSAVMNLEKNKADELGIALNANIVLPQELPFLESDFCSLSMNLLDNALEECERTEKEKKVNVIMTMRGDDYFYFCVTNPTDKTASQLENGLSSSKENREMHGYGLNIIRKIAQKYDGHFHYHIENGIFFSEILLNTIGGEAIHE